MLGERVGALVDWEDGPEYAGLASSVSKDSSENSASSISDSEAGRKKGLFLLDKGLSAMKKGFSRRDKPWSESDKGLLKRKKGFFTSNKGLFATSLTQSGTEKGTFSAVLNWSVSGFVFFAKQIKLPNAHFRLFFLSNINLK